MNKIYPRLERHKLKRIKKGERPYSTIEQKKDYARAYANRMNTHTSVVVNSDGVICCNAGEINVDFPPVELTFQDVGSLRGAYLDNCYKKVFAEMMQAKFEGRHYEYISKTPPPIIDKPKPKQGKDSGYYVNYDRPVGYLNF